MTVHGIERIREFLGEYKSNYVIIGGSATNINLTESALEGRATHDIDMIMVCEAITPEYLSSFWNMIRMGGYTPGMINTPNGPKRTFYRFDKPKDDTFPKNIELFCRVPESINIPKDMHLIHISSEVDYLSSFSAIMMDENYYKFAVTHTVELQGVQVLDKLALIVLKAKAFISNFARKESGQRVQQDDIDKHKRDIYRISFLLEETENIEIPEIIKDDLRLFIDLIANHPINTKALANYMGVAEVAQSELIKKLQKTFNL